MLFSHNKSVNSIFSHALSVKWTVNRQQLNIERDELDMLVMARGMKSIREVLDYEVDKGVFGIAWRYVCLA